MLEVIGPANKPVKAEPEAEKTKEEEIEIKAE
jgi:hypothetical protein